MTDLSYKRGSQGFGAFRAVVVATAGLLLAALVTAVFVGMARDTGQRLISPLPAVPADVLACALAIAGALLTTWFGFGVVAAALSVLPGAVGRMAQVVADRVAPAAVRRGVAFLLGTALVTSFAAGAAVGSPLSPGQTGSGAGVAGTTHVIAPGPDLRPESATDAPDPSLRPTGATSSTRIAGPRPNAGPTPRAAPTASAAPTPSSHPTPGTAGPSTIRTTPSTSGPSNLPTTKGSAGLGPLGPSSPRPSFAAADRHGTAALPSRTESVVVRGGDTLWDIAAAHLGSGATNVAVAAEWQRWYAVNADLIGGDPDLIRPGQRLVAPSPLHPTAATAPTDGAS